MKQEPMGRNNTVKELLRLSREPKPKPRIVRFIARLVRVQT